MKLILAFAAAGLVTAPLVAAPPCRNTQGKFVKCPTASQAKSTIARGKDGKCRWASGPKKGQFTKCP